MPRADPEPPRRLQTWQVAALAACLAVLAMLMLLAAIDESNRSTLWTRAHLTLAPAITAVVLTVSARTASGRTRVVRGWIAAATWLWLLAELIRNVELVTGSQRAPSIADLVSIGLIACAIPGYVGSVRGRATASEQTALFLDATTLFAWTTAVLLIAFGQAASRSVIGAIDLAYAVFFLATAGATLLLDLMVRVERRLSGAYVVLIGLATLGAGFLWRLAAPPTTGLHEGGPPAMLASLGVIVAMFGAATWTDRVDDEPSYVRFAARLRAILPIAAVATTPLLLMAEIVLETPEPIGDIGLVTLAVVIVTVAIRQSILLRESDGAVARERSLSSEIAKAEAKYRTLVERQPGVVYLAEPGEAGRWHYVSPQIEQMLGYSADEWTTDPTLWARCLHPDDRERILKDEDLPGMERAHGSQAWEYRLRALDGRWVWVRDDEAVTGEDTTGHPTLVQGVLFDITDRKEAEEALRVTEEQTRMIIETASYAFIGMNAAGVVTEWNQSAVDLFGWPRDEAIGREVSELIVPESQREAHVAGLRRYLDTGEGPILRQRVEVTALHRDGREFPIELTVWPLIVHGEAHFSALVDDITARKELEEQLRHQALHDSLTGLANRALFIDRVQHALDRSDRQPERQVAVLFCDLDDFKTINDSLGHAAGDELLVAVANRIRGALRAEDTASRLGGDEFAILLENARPGDPRRIASRILQLISQPFTIGGSPVSTQASMGIAFSGPQAATPDELLRNADLAMYMAKSRGKGRHEVYEPGLHEQAVSRLRLKGTLETAIAADELEVHYQPIVSLDDRSIVGLEALLRWRAADGQFVPLTDLITIAEETGLIVPVGRFVLQRACADARIWRDQLGAGDRFDIAVNVSGVQLELGGLAREVEGTLAKSGMEPSSLVLEITESTLSSESLDVLRTIRELRSLGVRLALDDFGIGYSSLARLRRFPVDIVKIDRSFVAAIAQNREGLLVQSIIDLGVSMGLEVVAEGIETQAQLTALQARGATLGQGFYFAKPMPAEAIGPILAAGRLPLSRRPRRSPVAKGA